MRIDGNVDVVGFYTTRFVESATPDAVEEAAVALIRQDPDLKYAVVNDRDDLPMIFVDEITEIPEANVPGVGRGFTFFSAPDP